MTRAEELAAYGRAAFGWDGDVAVSPGPRGALGQIWRIETGHRRYALKEIFAEPPSEALIAAELAFTRRAAAAGVRLPAGRSALDGRHVVTTPDGTWLRLYDWADLRPVAPSDPATPGAVGTLLARLHLCAPAMAAEAGGGPPASWYDRVPAEAEWAQVTGSDATWAPRLAELVTTVPELCAAVTPIAQDRPVDHDGPVDRDRPVGHDGLIACHRDLHPENVLAGPDGELVVVDWDNLGPATADRELAQAMFDWFHWDNAADLAAMKALYDAYVRAGGPGRVSRPEDFSMVLATRLNFVLVQARVALDPGAEPRHREWAEREVNDMLGAIPTPRQLAGVLALTKPR